MARISVGSSQCPHVALACYFEIGINRDFRGSRMPTTDACLSRWRRACVHFTTKSCLQLARATVRLNASYARCTQGSVFNSIKVPFLVFPHNFPSHFALRFKALLLTIKTPVKCYFLQLVLVLYLVARHYGPLPTSSE